MAKVRTEHKEKLLASGKWPDFVLYRDELTREGVKGAEANRLAVLKFLGEEAAANPGESTSSKRYKSPGQVSRRPPAKGVEMGGPPPAAVPDTGPVVGKVQDSPPGDAVSPSPPVMAGDVLQDGLDTKAMLWVVRQLSGMPGVQGDPCPDPAAQTFLNTCRESAVFKQNFMLKYADKIVRFDRDGDAVADNALERVHDAIGKLLSISRGSMKGDMRESHNLDVAGSSPAPATIPGGG